MQCVPADRAANLVLERIERLQQGGLHGHLKNQGCEDCEKSKKSNLYAA